MVIITRKLIYSYRMVITTIVTRPGKRLPETYGKITMLCSWANQLFRPGPCSIAFCMFTALSYLKIIRKKNKSSDKPTNIT